MNKLVVFSWPLSKEPKHYISDAQGSANAKTILQEDWSQIAPAYFPDIECG